MTAKRRPVVDLGAVAAARNDAKGPEEYRIGEVADRLKLSTRTLRYYEELGLVGPSSYTTGGSRRYTEADMARVLRIRNLQTLMGFDLEEIADILAAEDRLGDLWSGDQAGDVSAEEKAQIVIEVAERNARTQELVVIKIANLLAFRADLESVTEQYRSFAAENQITLPATCFPTFPV